MSVVAPATFNPQERAPWVSGSAIKQCPTCGCDFGLFTRRHHCRHCGGVYCASCTDRTAKGVRGYSPKDAVRVCRTCFYNELAYMVVWHSAFSYHCEIAGDELSAKKVYLKCPDYASRVFMKLYTGEVVSSWFNRESWRKKIMTHAQCKRNQYRQPTPSGQLPIGHADPLAVPRGVLTTGTPTSPMPPAPQAPQALRMALLAAWKTNDDDSPTFQHTWIHSVGGPEAALNDAKMLLSNIKPYTGVVMNLSGEALHVVNSTWTTRQETVIGQAKYFMNNMSSTMGWHAGGEYHTRRAGTNLLEALKEMVELGPQVSALLMDDFGSIIADTSTNPSWREGIAKHVGQELLKRQRIEFVVVCTSQQDVRQFTSMYHARLMIMSNIHSACFMPSSHEAGATGVLNMRHPLNTKEAALALSTVAQNCIDNELRSTVPPAAAATENGEEAPRGNSPLSAGRAALELECEICMTAYDTGDGKPCLCPSCGNTLCGRCATQVSHCPYCRNPMTNPITNVQLLQLVQQQQ